MSDQGPANEPDRRTNVQEEPCALERSASSTVRTLSSRDLLGERGVLRIEHDGEFYTLRITRNNRLILTK
jgi:hemin uptake protein HemP